MDNGSTAAPRSTVGVDLGGTKVKVAVVDPEGGVVTSRRCATEADRDADAIIDDLVATVRRCIRDAGGDRPGAVGVGVAGQVDAGTGEVRFAPNLEWRDVALGERMADRLGLPVLVGNDVRVITYGEWRHGAGRDDEDLVCVFVGTGVGGGVVAGGRLLEGCSNTAGEIGHLTVVADGRACSCRNRGCLEAYVGGWAIAARAQDAVRADPDAGSGLVERAGSVDAITAATVGRAYHDDDPLARAIIEETGRYLGAGLVGLANALGPCRLILGGGVLDGIPELLTLAETHLRNHALEAALVDLEVVEARLGDEAGVIGSAAFARDRAPRP